MNTTSASLPDLPPAAGASAPPPGLWWKLGTPAAVLLAAALAWQGGAVGTTAAVGLGALLVLGQRRGATAPAGDTGAGPAAAPNSRQIKTAAGGRFGAEVMVEQVVPVWSRQMEVTREAASAGLAQLLDNFAGLSTSLEQLAGALQGFSPSAAPGAMDEAVQSQSPALDALLAPSERAFRQRDEAVAVLARCADALTELQQQAKVAHEISRHTRLVAFNASIEAHRGGGGGGGGGSQAVAMELRDLAARMAASGEAVHRVVAQLGQAVGAARRAGDIQDTSTSELRLELQIKARDALTALLGAVGTSLGSSRAMKETSEALRSQLEEAFVNFQFGDRVSQMLSIVGNDMSNFATWVARNPRATQTDAAEWLEALEASYTMEEQRAHHHGNTHVDRGSEIEFF